jgi:glycosyltransferase involved in cell wall biosynthesis
MPYLNEVLPVLKALEEKVSFEFCVISNIAPAFELKSLRFVPWKKETEVQDLLRFNIGIMPLTEDPWSKGKCGFKALQYMSLGIPALVSPVGVNKVIVDNDINGFICSNYSEWLEGLEVLISNISKRETMGKAAKEKVKFNYSVKANTKNFLSLFE